MAFSKTNVTLEDLTLDLAKRIAEMSGLPGERPVKVSRLAYLNTLRRTGRFTSPTWAVVVDAVTGQRYRANGQHSSRMLIDLPLEEFPSGLHVTIEEYTTDDFGADAFEIFEIFDNPRSARSNTDKMGTFRARFPDLQGIKLEVLVAVANGIDHYEHDRDGGITLTPRQRGVHYERPEVREFAVWVAGFEDSLHGWMLSKSGVVAEMFATTQVDKSAAEEFWKLAFDESHPDPDHESREVSRNIKELAPRPKVGQARLRKEAAKFWRRYRRTLTPIAA